MKQDIFKLIKTMENQLKGELDSNRDFEMPQDNLMRVVDINAKKQFIFNDERAYIFHLNRKNIPIGFELNMKPLEKEFRKQLLKNLAGKNYTIIKNFILLEPRIEKCISIIDFKKKQYMSTDRRDLVEFLLKF